MAKSSDLRSNKAQHAPKNVHSKRSDKAIHEAMLDCIGYLNKRMAGHMDGYSLEFDTKLSYLQLIDMIRVSGQRSEFDPTFADRTIKPDGGVIWLTRPDDEQYRRLVVVSEVKKQGTNKERIAEGRGRQAQGNAIERLGKNLIGIRAALNHEVLTPFVCFGWGCDFEENYDEGSFVMSKVSMMNEFYPLNRTYVFKKDGSSDKNRFAPVSMYFREPEWQHDEMFHILKEVAETSLRYYLF
ncbi:MAG: restriction endonuclease [Spirochaetaceae bacterium]|nr:restriction endonuclease [Spirochaetaceae bacterium]